MTDNNPINITEQTRIAYYATNLNSATQYLYYTNSFVFSDLMNLPDLETTERFLRYQAAIIGNQLNSVSSTPNTSNENSPGTYLIAILQENITLVKELVDTARELRSVIDPSTGQIYQPIQTIIDELRTNALEIANLFTIVGGNRVTVSEGQELLYQYINYIIAIAQAQLVGNYTQSLKFQTILQTLSLPLADYLTRAIFGGNKVEYYVGDESFSGYGVPENITLEMLRMASN